MPRETENKKNSRPIQVTSYKVNKPMELLDFLLLKLNKQSRNNVKSLLTHKMVMVNGIVTSQYNFALSKDDLVEISKTPMKQKEKAKKSKLKIIYEDDEFVVINKPSGLLSIGTEKEREKTAYALVMDYVKSANMKNRIYVVHRIDKETSGVLLFAKNEKIKNKLQDNWNDLVSIRKYYAVVCGKLEKKSGTIRSWLKETSTNLMYSSFTPNDGQEAITHYQVLKENEKFSLLEVNIDTGRKNQIRVHLKGLGHGVVGDEKYNIKTNPLNRLGLHNAILEFKHPFNKKIYKFEAPMPIEFNQLFQKVKKNS